MTGTYSVFIIGDDFDLAEISSDISNYKLFWITSLISDKTYEMGLALGLQSSYESKWFSWGFYFAVSYSKKSSSI